MSTIGQNDAETTGMVLISVAPGPANARPVLLIAVATNQVTVSLTDPWWIEAGENKLNCRFASGAVDLGASRVIPTDAREDRDVIVGTEWWRYPVATVEQSVSVEQLRSGVQVACEVVAAHHDDWSFNFVAHRDLDQERQCENGPSKGECLVNLMVPEYHVDTQRLVNVEYRGWDPEVLFTISTAWPPDE